MKYERMLHCECLGHAPFRNLSLLMTVPYTIFVAYFRGAPEMSVCPKKEKKGVHFLRSDMMPYLPIFIETKNTIIKYLHP